MGKEFDLGTRLQALTLHSEGYSRAAIAEKTGYTSGGLCNLLAKAKRRGYKRGEGPILLEYVAAEAGRGRPPILTDERKQKITAMLTSEEACRKFSAQQLADKLNEQNIDQPVSRRTVLRALKAEGFKKVKDPTKPGWKRYLKQKQ
ncbi:hypothetical protein F4801DRAFT_122107 [Xylaria longipes]|nr:hypothetical protein F4801DRAFT_122107 [Xylaria longipes]RYC55999.1 hypothetical protein CHU98_g10211 [Xylaria longipes]